MKKSVLIFSAAIAVASIAIGFFAGTMYSKSKETEVASEGSLINIRVENEEKIPIDYIFMGEVIDGEEVISDVVEGKDIDGDRIDLPPVGSISENVFFLKGVSDGKEIEACYFEMAKYSDTYVPETLTFGIKDYKVYQK